MWKVKRGRPKSELHFFIALTLGECKIWPKQRFYVIKLKLILMLVNKMSKIFIKFSAKMFSKSEFFLKNCCVCSWEDHLIVFWIKETSIFGMKSEINSIKTQLIKLNRSLRKLPFSDGTRSSDSRVSWLMPYQLCHALITPLRSFFLNAQSWKLKNDYWQMIAYVFKGILKISHPN